MADDVTRLIREIERTPGWRVVKGSRHYKVWNPAGEYAATIPITPFRGANSRSQKNTMGHLKRAGWKPEQRGQKGVR